MKSFSFTAIALAASLTLSLGVITHAEADTSEKGKPFFASVRESLKSYQSAQQAARKTPNEIATRKRLLVSYLLVIDSRLERMAEAVRKIAPALTSNVAYLERIAADRAEIASLMTQIEQAETSQDLSSLTERIRSLGTFTNITMSRARVLAAHRDVLQSKGITVLEPRIEQMSYALEILAEQGKDVSHLQESLTNMRTQVATGKQQIESLTIGESIDANMYAEKRNALNGIEAMIRSVFADLDTLSQKGREIRDAE